MGLLSKFENKMEDGIEGAAGALGRSGLSPVQITKKAEKQMRREKIVGAGKQYAPTLYTVLVSAEDDSKLFKYYPTLAGETETYLLAKAREMGYVMDGQPLVRFLSDPQLKKGKFEVVAEMVAASIVDQLRDDEMRRYGLPTGAGRRRVAPVQRERNLQPSMQPLPHLADDVDEYGAPASGMDAAGQGYGAQAGYDDGYGGMPARGGNDPRQQVIQRHPMSASDMGVPSVLGSQVSEVQQESRMPRGVSDSPERGRSRRGSVRPEQLLGDVQMAQQVGASVAAEAALAGEGGQPGAPVVVVPALSADFPGGQAVDAGGRGSGVDALFGDAGSASAMDADGRGGMTQRVFLYDEARDRAYALTGDRQNIGRESANDIVVPDINISRVHAEIHMQPNGQWVISDLGSTNGLYVNGQKVQSAQLKDADMITVGTSTLEFQLLS